MSLKIERPSPCTVTVTADIPVAEVTEEREHVVKEIARKARIPGFRPGKAPRSVIEHRHAEMILEELKEHLLHKAWDQVQEQETVHPASPLKVKKADIEADGSFRVEAELEVFPEVTLPDLADFTPPELAVEPTDEDVANAMVGLQQRQATWEPADDAAIEDGMLVEAEVWGEYPDGEGEPFHEERALFRQGAGEVVPEFEAAAKGARVGDEVTATRTVERQAEGEDQPPVSVTIAYRIKIKSLRRERLPELDEAFATSLGVAGGMEPLKVQLLAKLKVEKAKARVDAWRTALIGYLAGDEPVPMPETAVDEGTREELIELARTMAARGIDPDKAKIDWNKLGEAARARVTDRLRAELLLDALAEKLDVEITPADVDHALRHEAEHARVPFAELKGNMAKSGGLHRIAAALRRQRAADAVLQPFVEGASR